MRVIVVGAGILGASAAYHLAKAGAEVEIIDADHPGKATMAGAGIICPWASQVDNPAWYRLSAASAKYYPDLAAALVDGGERANGYRRVGALITSEIPADLAAAEKRLRARHNDAPEAGTITRFGNAEARKLFPPFRDDLEAIHVSGAARVEARAFSAAMLKLAVAHGAVQRNERVSLHREADRAVCIGADGKKIDGDSVILAGGAWAPEVLKPIGIELPIAPQKGQILHFGMGGVDTSNWPVLLPMNSYYMLCFDDSRVVVGATRETGSGFDYRVTAAGQSEVLGFALSFAPGLRNATLLETRIGFRPAGPSYLPMLGPATGIQGLLIGNGLGAGGLTMGPMAGRLLAEAALGQKPALNLADYAF
ncbi:MAG: FAD-binding oxidoreductase [Alphaproteobacteria bacterium]|nr:FAD-binding oxidoreductase [Alphaproteobacteria bacterium]